MSWIAVELFNKGMIKIGHFKLTSGIESPFYIDLRKLYSYPELARRIVYEIIARFEIEKYDVIVGIATAGIALAAYIAALTGKPMAYIRMERKEHGMRNIIEGEVANRKCIIIDDVATTGGSIERAYKALKEAGSKPTAAGVIVDREQGARERLARIGLEFYYLVTAKELFAELHKHGLISEDIYINILRYLERRSLQSL